jgi:cellulose synthase/poly-beta-1,6-N-acetylglucosamine synthase-like glycosyltransferase
MVSAGFMFDSILNILTVIHFCSIAGLALYGIHRIWLLIAWYQKIPGDTIQSAGFLSEEFPLVTVQVPLYNEPMVCERIIDAVAKFDWPEDKLEIQILDDSNDHTAEIANTRVKLWAENRRNIYLIFRQNRTGYKAGALANGLKQAKGEFIAIFDADFIPLPDFLKKTIPQFSNPEVGMVQTRWGFVNTGYSWLTRLQGLLLSSHFDIEHAVRFKRRLFFNFNGTAGIWRRKAIESAGGWQSDTVTEDLDLSYRAQLAGWQFVFLNDVVVPSELPVTLSDFRCQQERWSKGSIQTAKKMLPKILASSVPIAVKIEAVAHLLVNFCWLFGFVSIITLYPVLLCRIQIGPWQMIWIDVPLFLLSGAAVLIYYFIYGFASTRNQFLKVLPLLPALSIGLAPCLSLSVLKGLFQKGGLFKRTPKFGISDNMPANGFRFTISDQTAKNLILNIPLLIYSMVPLIFAWERGTWPAIPLLCLFPMGFSLVVGNDLMEMFIICFYQNKNNNT